MKLAVLTDTSATFTNMSHFDNLFILDIPINIDGIDYIENKNITIDDFYIKMRQAEYFPKTSQPSIGATFELVERLVKEGYDTFIGLFLSSGISGYFQTVQILKTQFPEVTFHFVDSKITSAPLGEMVKTALLMNQQNESIEQIIATLGKLVAETAAYIIVDDLNHLVRGGRLKASNAMIGNLLKIKPILMFDDGEIVPAEKVRTQKKAIKRLIQLVKERTEVIPSKIWVIHANAFDKAAEVKAELNSLYGLSVEIVPFNAVIATHLGEGAIGVGFTPILSDE
ncbi:MAG: DegV family protein [Streptococcaceae bacterium]|jgi:DegV family protein with EDD domain|nr:DegV family protein [Streptococcaceae bacterium]MCH4175973.1 DegV family protein [Streptococcaceae bacterium]